MRRHHVKADGAMHAGSCNVSPSRHPPCGGSGVGGGLYVQLRAGRRVLDSCNEGDSGDSALPRRPACILGVAGRRRLQCALLFPTCVPSGEALYACPPAHAVPAQPANLLLLHEHQAGELGQEADSRDVGGKPDRVVLWRHAGAWPFCTSARPCYALCSDHMRATKVWLNLAFPQAPVWGAAASRTTLSRPPHLLCLEHE